VRAQRLVALLFVLCAGAGLAGQGTPGAATPTFARDVAPILSARCVECHRPDGSAPFSLLTYGEARARARQIASAVARGSMPPWKPDPGFGRFSGERRLTPAEVMTIQNWVAAGAPAGRGGDLQERRHVEAGWQLGPPDLIVSFGEYEFAAGGAEQLRNFVAPIAVSGVRYVRAWEFRPNTPAAVHHATFMIDPSHAARTFDAQDPQPGYEGLIPLAAHHPAGYFLGWTPGQAPYRSPDGMAWKLEPGNDLIAMLHLRSTGRVERISGSLGLYFADAPPAVTPVMIRLNRQDIDIPAGESRFTMSDTYELPVAVTAYAVQPHAHYLARSVDARAVLPDGTMLPLIRISDWDFHWQDHYRFAAPIRLPRGTQLAVTFTYDNSDANRANPNHPPRRVTYGQRSNDEMGDLWIQVVPDDPRDADALTRSLDGRQLVRNIAGYRMLIEQAPANPSLHDDLALLYAQAGDLENCAAQFARSLELQPGVAAAHYNLGNALIGLGRLPEAERELSAAVALAPGYTLARQALERVVRARAAGPR
jgi:mono/diheme cytochrome c family protein